MSVAAAKPPALAQTAEQEPAASAADAFEVLAPKERQQHTARTNDVALATALSRKWSSVVGKTTFRSTLLQVAAASASSGTNAVANGSLLVIGSHGRSLQGINEPDDGIYVLEAATGKRRALFAAPGTGDRDVGGVAFGDGKLFFGTDNGWVGAMTLQGKLLWKQQAQGKVRPAPTLVDLNADGLRDLVVGDERGVLRALDGATGKLLWMAASGSNEYGAVGYLAGAASADLDGDGKPDVVAGPRDGVLRAFRGFDGQLLWDHGESSGMHASPSLVDFDHDGKLEVLAAWSYGDLIILDAKTGAVRWRTRLEQDGGGIEGLFATPTPLSGQPGVLIAPVAWWGAPEDGVVGVGLNQRIFKSSEGRVSSSAVVTDLDGDGELEAILGTEAGALVALRANGQRVLLSQLGGPIEATPLLADVDGNGSFELLVASNDGRLTCFETGSRAKPALSRFRGEDLGNTGVLAPVDLHWNVTAAKASLDSGSARFYERCCQALGRAYGSATLERQRKYGQARDLCRAAEAADVAAETSRLALAQALKGVGVPAECR